MATITTNGNGEGVTIDYIAHNCHRGKLRAFYTEDIGLDTGETLDILLEVGCYPLHIVLGLEVLGGQCTADIHEGIEVSANGELLRTSRFNRIVKNDVCSKVYKNPTVTNLGDKFVARRVLASSQGSSRISSSLRSGVERELKPYTKYLVRVTSLADNVIAVLDGIFYEGK